MQIFDILNTGSSLFLWQKMRRWAAICVGTMSILGCGSGKPGQFVANNYSVKGDTMGARPFECNDSDPPLMFKDQTIVNMRISADFTTLNSVAAVEDSSSVATIEVEGAAQLKADLVGRGKSRFLNCAFRPFSLKELKSDKYNNNLKGTLFKGLGNSVKFSTHCGSDSEEEISDEGYDQRVLMEHSVYQVLDKLQVPSLKTRMVRLTYHDTNPESKALKDETHLAFVREPEDTMAKRCGMVELEEFLEGGGTSPPQNLYSEMLMHLLNAFIIQSDWDLPDHNIIPLVHTDSQEMFYAPYDFDLVGIFEEYIRHPVFGIEGNGVYFAEWLRLNHSPTLLAEVHRMLEQIQSMSDAIDQVVGLSEENNKLFHDWLTLFGNILKSYSECENHVNDPSWKECYVQDDQSDTVPIDLNTTKRWKTVLEPPGDKDMFAVTLKAGTLYTLKASSPYASNGSDTSLELLDENGNRLAFTDVGAVWLKIWPSGQGLRAGFIGQTTGIFSMG